MFENMMKYKKAWELFVDWHIKHMNTNFTLGIYENEIKLLFIMPLFFDKNEIFIHIDKRYGYYVEIDFNVYKNNKKEPEYSETIKVEPYDCDFFGSYERALIKGCEKAFEILEKKNV